MDSLALHSAWESVDGGDGGDGRHDDYDDRATPPRGMEEGRKKKKKRGPFSLWKSTHTKIIDMQIHLA